MATVSGLTPYGGPFRETHVVPKKTPNWDTKPFKGPAVSPIPHLDSGVPNMGMKGNGAQGSHNPPGPTKRTKQPHAKIPADVYKQVVKARKRHKRATNTLNPKQV